MPGYNLEGELKLYEQEGGYANQTIIIEDNGKEIALDQFLAEAMGKTWPQAPNWPWEYSQRWSIRIDIWLDPIID